MVLNRVRRKGVDLNDALERVHRDCLRDGTIHQSILSAGDTFLDRVEANRVHGFYVAIGQDVRDPALHGLKLHGVRMARDGTLDDEDTLRDEYSIQEVKRDLVVCS